MQWIVLDMAPASNAITPSNISPRLVAVAPPTMAPSDLAAALAQLDAALNGSAAQKTSSSTTDSATDGTALVAMAGRYVGQINAHIDRAWLRPRTPIGAPIFSCRVRIDQDEAGNVLGVTLESCNGDTRWRRSLVQAIESASPLPAPPDPAVFAATVHMSFQAQAYTPGAPASEYEPARLAEAGLAAPPAQRTQQALKLFRDALQKAHSNEVIKLTITGGADSPGAEGSSVLPVRPLQIPPPDTTAPQR